MWHISHLTAFLLCTERDPAAFDPQLVTGAGPRAPLTEVIWRRLKLVILSDLDDTLFQTKRK